jgi:hypothetical protein
MENEVVKEIEYETVPAVARFEEESFVRVSGRRYNQIQDALLKVAFLEKVAESKFTVFEKVTNNYGTNQRYIYRCYGPDQLAQKIVELGDQIETKDAELERLKSNVSLWKEEVTQARGKIESLEKFLNISRDELEKYKKRGFWKRLFNTTV